MRTVYEQIFTFPTSLSVTCRWKIKEAPLRDDETIIYSINRQSSFWSNWNLLKSPMKLHRQNCLREQTKLFAFFLFVKFVALNNRCALFRLDSELRLRFNFWLGSRALLGTIQLGHSDWQKVLRFQRWKDRPAYESPIYPPPQCFPCNGK